MRRLSRNNNLRLGIILMVTGIIALAHALLSSSNHLGSRPTFVIGSYLSYLGCPSWSTHCALTASLGEAPVIRFPPTVASAESQV